MRTDNGAAHSGHRHNNAVPSTAVGLGNRNTPGSIRENGISPWDSSSQSVGKLAREFKSKIGNALNR
jgi:hypothetical protein